MFSIIAFIIWIIVLPLALGKSVAFHSIKEEQRYEAPKMTTSFPEKLLNIICGCTLLILTFSIKYIPSITNCLIPVFGICLLALSVFYLIKISLSVFSGYAISVLVGFTLITKTNKSLALLLFILSLLVALENLHIIYTYYW